MVFGFSSADVFSSNTSLNIFFFLLVCIGAVGYGGQSVPGRSESVRCTMSISEV
jgi:hypothetical protein